jgi:response regulator RpfG family c-di-GMP phosphodiesterase
MSSYKVLFVDAGILRDSISSRLRSSGFEVLEARTGLEGLEKAISGLPSAIILNYDLKGLTGPELAKKLKDNSLTRNIPLIGCSNCEWLAPDDSNLETQLEYSDVSALLDALTILELDEKLPKF